MTTENRPQRDMLQDPCWQAKDLGAPMPDSPHAASACLPLWQHNIDYEENVPEVVDRLQAAYPRFCLHPFIRSLCRKVFGDENRGLIFPSRRVALSALQYVRSRGVKSARLHELDHHGPTGVVCAEDFSVLREYWQHSGRILTSRAAELLLAGQPVSISETTARTTVRRRLADFSGCAEADVRLFPSGMAAVCTAWEITRRIDPDSPSLQFGFPYVDTLKIQQRFPPQKWNFLPAGDAADLDALKQILSRQKISAVFCESPANPLLTEPDLQTLRSLADEYGFLLVIDDTLSAVINRNLLDHADLLVTSLTKYFSGIGDVLAGSLRINPSGPHAARIRETLDQDFEELLCDSDADVLESNSRDLQQRVTVINANAAVLAERLRQHPAVQQVFYPASATSSDSAIPTGGGLMSIVLRDPERTTAPAFDRLAVCKGPNLGTNFTLCCPYTLLAHYSELDEVEQCGVSRWLLRISVGTEPLEQLWGRFERALHR